MSNEEINNMRIINIETKANHIIENFYDSLDHESLNLENELELYILEEGKSDPNFFNWLLQPMTIEESDYVENLSSDQMQEYIQLFCDFTKNYINQ